MKNYKVIKEEGVRTIAGELKKKGETFLGSPRSATIQLQLRCKEIEEVKEKEAEPQPPKAPSTVEALKAALTGRGVKIPEDAKKADLEKLFNESTPDPS